MTAENVLKKLRAELTANSDEKIKESGKRFFKEEIKLYGIKTNIVSKLSKSYYKDINCLPKTEIYRLCEELWQSGYMEESFIACNWSYNSHKEFTENDFSVFEKWIGRYITNWAACDTFCNHTVGEFIEKFPQFISELKKWAKSDNRWFRRAAAVSLIIPAKKGKFLKDIIEIADILLTDKDDLVQKGYGWLLKSAAHTHQYKIFNYVISRKKIMPRTALRYAIEKMPKELKTAAMKKD